MRTTVTIDDAIYEKALEMADPDMALLASTLITQGAELWTLDQRLAGRFAVAHQPMQH